MMNVANADFAEWDGQHIFHDLVDDKVNELMAANNIGIKIMIAQLLAP